MADLSKFGIPLNGQNQGVLHPKQKYRFRVIFNNFGINSSTTVMTSSVVSATRPKLEQTEFEIHAYNSVVYIGGKHTWTEITVVLRDDINNSVIAAVGAQMQKQINHYEQTSAVAGINYKFTMKIDSLDGTTNEELERWELDGCWIKNVTYPEGDYSSSDANQVELSIRYDVATNIGGRNDNEGAALTGDPMPNVPSPTGGSIAT